jgi:hypothetical protein
MHASQRRNKETRLSLEKGMIDDYPRSYPDAADAAFPSLEHMRIGG